ERDQPCDLLDATLSHAAEAAAAALRAQIPAPGRRDHGDAARGLEARPHAHADRRRRPSGEVVLPAQERVPPRARREPTLREPGEGAHTALAELNATRRREFRRGCSSPQYSWLLSHAA